MEWFLGKTSSCSLEQHILSTRSTRFQLCIVNSADTRNIGFLANNATTRVSGLRGNVTVQMSTLTTRTTTTRINRDFGVKMF